MCDAQTALDDTRERSRLAFLNREAAEVYLLLDFLSGRTDRSLRPTQEEQARSLLDRQNGLPIQAQADDEEKKRIESERKTIEDDLSDPTRLVLRTMSMQFPLKASDDSFRADATFLMRARDVLNTRAAPASGLTIAFTSMVADGQADVRAFAEDAYPQYKKTASRLANSIVRIRRLLVWVLVLALLVSAYAAWGKVMLDTLDAVRRDDGAVQKELGAARLVSKDADPCTDPSNNPVCASRNEIKTRYSIASYQLAKWEPAWPYGDVLQQETKDADSNRVESAGEQKRIEERAIAWMAVLGSYIMPSLYGLLGSMAFVLRRHYDRLAAQLLVPRDRQANSIRLILGVVIGGCIGLVYAGAPTVQTTGILGAAVTLSTAAIAFLAGYGVEGVFKALEALIAQVFGVNGKDIPKQAVG
jgi:hypothetical protein